MFSGIIFEFLSKKHGGNVAWKTWKYEIVMQFQ